MSSARRLRGHCERSSGVIASGSEAISMTNSTCVRDCVVAALLAMTLALGAAGAAAAPQDCVPAGIVLWGDGRHDDTRGLNAWLRGEGAIWGESGAPVGPSIEGHVFRLSAAIYVRGGTGRSLEDFRLIWPERGETVTGGTISAGSNPDAAPVSSGVRITGGDPTEGKPFETPDAVSAAPRPEESCATS